MKIEQRLAHMQRHLGVTTPPQRPQRPSTRRPQGIGDLVDGKLVEADGGHCFVAETARAVDDQHGRATLRRLHGLSGTQFSLICRDPELAYVDVSKAVFLDTETTGLGMGTGTYVFLVGAGYLDGDQFRVNQFFLRGPGEEQRFLSVLGAFLANFSSIVTFNGKAFDWPLLENRFVRHRRRAPFNDPPHVDLLHPARALWKKRLESCALSSLENHILGVTRTEEDVPGYDIPRRYFMYQQTGDARELQGVFYHNLQDILSLAALAIHIDRVLADPACGEVVYGLDYLCLGRAYDRAGESEGAALCYEEALRRDLPTVERQDCLARLATVQKRLRWWDAAMQTWYRLLDDGGPSALFAHVEMAKYFEHVERDYAQALEAVQSALTLVQLGQNDLADILQVDLEHRLARLLNRRAGGRGRSRSWA